MVRGDQRVARKCYSASMKQKAVDNIYLDELDIRDEVNTIPEPSEELEPVPLDDNPEHLAYIGSKLAKDLRSLLTHFLRQNKDVFTWKQAKRQSILQASQAKEKELQAIKAKGDQRGSRKTPPGRGNQ